MIARGPETLGRRRARGFGRGFGRARGLARRWARGIGLALLWGAPVVHTASAAASKPLAGAERKACLQANSDGQDLRAAGKLRAAREALLACAHDPCPGPVQTDCSRWVAELDLEIPSLVVRVTRDGADDATASVEIDGVAVALNGQAIALDPGKHRVVVRVAGEADQELDAVLSTGDKNRIVTVTLPTHLTTKSVVAERPTASPEAANEAPMSRPAWPWVTAGVGVVAVGGFVYFAATGVREVHRLDGACAPRCDDDQVNAARRRLLFADVSLGVGLAAAALATYGFLSTSAAPRTTPEPAVTLLPGGCYASVQGAF